ncbi:hypothetical protein F0L17_16610 [Streptomyces sp. TRM43335]|uniref:Uncharacterized protein n=1 Tax=Streptomyces taklimakanensis TaxID=2569853 RepID=A0A6G2BFM2_9ACTN|nr:hypothetical protein [Streptomyces taklimakanensis]MTE20702.1 hypothetical protein [Streptomyces taklimakanensis]
MSPRRVQLLAADTPHGIALLAAAVDAGLLGEGRERLLLTASRAPAPETVPAPDETPGPAALLNRFDRVLSWSRLIRPLHPAAWAPRPDDAPLWERQLRSLWGLEDAEVELVVERVGTGPARALARIFPDAPLVVYATGLSAYGPTPGKLDPLVGTRVRRLLHPPLLPAARPLLLSEFGVPAEAVPAGALRDVAAKAARALPPTGAPEGAVVLLGNDPQAPGALPAAAEERLLVRTLRAVRETGPRAVVLAPHPAAPPPRTTALERAAAELGVELYVPEWAHPVEALYELLRPSLVIGRASGALPAASAVHGLPVARYGTRETLERMAPYENEDRVPAVIVDALVPEPAAGARSAEGADVPPSAGGGAPLGAEETAALVRAVAFCMWPRVLPELRDETERFLTAHPDERVRRYFARRRLASLGLPGGVPGPLTPVVRSPVVRRTALRARALGRGARR